MSASIVVLILIGLTLKHVLLEFVLYTTTQHIERYVNTKHNCNIENVIHSGLHGIPTLFIITGFTSAPILLAIGLTLFDSLSHYVIDQNWETQIENNFGSLDYQHPKPELFYWLHGFDQWLHIAVYLLILGILICVSPVSV